MLDIFGNQWQQSYQGPVSEQNGIMVNYGQGTSLHPDLQELFYLAGVRKAADLVAILKKSEQFQTDIRKANREKIAKLKAELAKAEKLPT